jgi:hypothetical protein
MSKRVSKEEILARIRIVHRNKYIYPDNLDGCKIRDKIPIYCPVNGHGVFYQTIEHHTQGQGCPKCHLTAIHQAKFIGREVWIDRFEKVHGKGKYDYSRLPQNPGADETFSIYCAEHDVIFCQTPNLHWRRKQGCPKCGAIKRWETRKENLITRSTFIEKAQLKNGLGYEYINLPKAFSLNDTIGIFCVAHNKLFFCKGNEHLEGKECPICESEKSLD